ncbi:tRNA 2-thiouridine(34) synthase MnmA [Patescibacteria group bacterium]|nr:tRNA 2-thiouridine(34) synthase MnmA [Patescibacteria group bacterium]
MLKKIRGKQLKVAAAVSGGVDSAVAAALLKKQGYQVTAVFMNCWQEGGTCNADEDRRAALQTAAQLELPFRAFNLQEAYRKKVLNYFYKEYGHGRTPNPDIMCNKEIKFGYFLTKALKELNADFIATGHYVRGNFTDGRYHLYRGVDETKDQSYFLYHLNQHQLSKSIFPVGEITKGEVRRIARRLGLSNWGKPDSQGLCFVGQIELFDFLRQRLPEKSGPVVNMKGEVIGQHRGTGFYTIGQRHGFEMKKYQGEPLYVISKEQKKNILVVGPREAAYQDSFSVSNLSWIQKQPYEGKCLVRIRHLGELVPAEIRGRPLKRGGPYKGSGPYLKVKLSRPVFAIAPGQSAVFYKEEEVIGGGTIS